MSKLKMLPVALAMLVGLITPIVAAAPAQASGSCSGTNVGTLTHRNWSGELVAYTGLYRTSSQFCAVTVKQGRWYGTRTRMYLTLISNRTYDDRGEFLYQAGAVWVPRGTCYYVNVGIWDGQGNKQVDDQSAQPVLGTC
ncbi:hypothetical protein KBX06_16265 [Micromonospora sp. C31]|uniref:hypothetical protein n=1 Tax=Micromonospora sp. C31 TaxID=2824876 RepID=UPI001B37330C|nr:hypothetical protein [Micromonospora sp. C31]MBQ1074708.1 hypothetical protein [Micromonospora sp. C31]